MRGCRTIRPIKMIFGMKYREARRTLKYCPKTRQTRVNAGHVRIAALRHFNKFDQWVLNI